MASATSWYDPQALSSLSSSFSTAVPTLGAADMAFMPASSAAIPTINVPAFGSNMGGGGLFGGMDGMDKIKTILGGLQTLGGLWSAWQSAKMASKQFNFTKDITNTNLNNQIKSYNTALSDRITTRAKMEGLSPEEASAYLASNSLSRHP